MAGERQARRADAKELSARANRSWTELRIFAAAVAGSRAEGAHDHRTGAARFYIAVHNPGARADNTVATA
jgi:hypothetical protein